MKYVVVRYVEADCVEQAVRKSRLCPIHDVYIHNDSWKDSGYSLKMEEPKKLGFNDAKKDR